MKTLIFITFLTAFSFGNYLSDDSVILYLKGETQVNLTWKKCFYSGNGFSFSVNVQGFCPMNIIYHPSSDTWENTW